MRRGSSSIEWPIAASLAAAGAARVVAVGNLTGEVEKLMIRLRAELAALSPAGAPRRGAR